MRPWHVSVIFCCALMGCRTVPPDDPSPTSPADPVIPATLLNRSVATPAPSAIPDWVRKVADVPSAVGLVGSRGADDDLFDSARLLDKQPVDVTFYVRRNETVDLYAKWSGISLDTIRDKSGLAAGDNLRVGSAVTIPLDAERLDRFETNREQFHSRYEQEFYSRFAEAGFKDYTIKKGDYPAKLQKMSGDGASAPLWLLEKHNPDVDFSLLQIGTAVRIPVLVPAPVAGAAGRQDDDDVRAPVAHGGSPARAESGLVTVRSGDTPGKLAAQHGVSVQQIMAANPGLDPRRMRIGQQVRIPTVRTGAVASPREMEPPRAAEHGRAPSRPDGADYEDARPAQGRSGRFTTHIVKSGENGWTIAVKRYGITTEALQDANPEVRIDRLHPGTVLRVPSRR